MSTELTAAARWVTAGVFEHLGIKTVVDRVGRYELIHQLGRGSYGRVWLARDPDLDCEVAIKMPRQLGDAAAQLEEARALALVRRHPNLVEVYDVGIEKGEVWIAMARIEGVTLREWLKTRHSRAQRLRVVRGLAAALVALHSEGLVHRDVKPENIMVTPEGEAVLTDLGLSRGEITYDAGGHIGSPGYIAPEVLAGKSTSPRSDQWAFATTALEVLDPVILSPHSLALARACRENPWQRWPDMETLAWKLRRRVVPMIIGSMVAGAALFALASRAAPARSEEPGLPDMPTEVVMLEAFAAASNGQPHKAFETWQGYERRNSPWGIQMSEHLARLLLENGRPIEAAWIGVNAAQDFEALSLWTEAARARDLAASAFEGAGGQVEAKRQRECAARNAKGEPC